MMNDEYKSKREMTNEISVEFCALSTIQLFVFICYKGTFFLKITGFSKWLFEFRYAIYIFQDIAAMWLS